ncbi:MAG: hypothetical protein PWQ91_1011 [Eubacteriales bacterium]|nr:hypothetical protein [Eubacteriales bacterium]MDN5363950.1 hypothetical protein [Eubacteriales bacterium]
MRECGREGERIMAEKSPTETSKRRAGPRLRGLSWRWDVVTPPLENNLAAAVEAEVKGGPVNEVNDDNF